MRVKLRNVCRGEGKLYFHIDIAGIEDTALLSFAAFTAEGAEVPQMVFADGSLAPVRGVASGRSFSAVLPLLACPIEFVCFALAPDGKSMGQHRIALHPFSEKWLSRINGRMSREETDALRQIERGRTLERVLVQVDRCIALPPDDRGIVRGKAYVPCSMADEPPLMRCFDESFEEKAHVEQSYPVSQCENHAVSSGPVWMIPFSFPVRLQGGVVLSVYRADGELLPGFESLSPWQLEELRDRSYVMFQHAADDETYREWSKADRLTPSELEIQRHRSFDQEPIFSIIVPLYRTPLDLFWEMAESVLSQTYDRWELVLVNASADDRELRAAVTELASSDGRVKVVELEENKGITLNTNAGVARATGGFIAFFDHDDVLAPDILFEYAKAINRYPDIDVLYCDEDKLTSDGEFVQPFFKPDFSIDLLRGNNYICHMLTIRASLLAELPDRGAELDGAQDHALVLAASEAARRVHHVPRILYHWRMTENSTAASVESKSYASDAGMVAVRQHLARLGLDADVREGNMPFTYDVDYAVAGNPLVSIIIPTCDHVETLQRCLHSIEELTSYDNYEIILVENNSKKAETFEYYEQVKSQLGKLRVVEAESGAFNYSKVVNFGASQARGDYYLMLNNDVEVITPRWIDRMLGICQRSDIGAVGARLLYPDDTIQHAGIVLLVDGLAHHVGASLPRSFDGYFGLLGQMRNVSAVTGACLMTSRDMFTQLDGFDEALSVAYNDIDYCLRLQEKGKLVVYTPYAELYHYESLSRGKDVGNQENMRRFLHEAALLQDRWAERYTGCDPYYNPNLDQLPARAIYYRLGPARDVR